MPHEKVQSSDISFLAHNVNIQIVSAKLVDWIKPVT